MSASQSRLPSTRCAAIAGLAGILGLAALVPACDDPTQVRVVLRVEDERFRPDFADLTWSRPGGLPRTARIPATGSLPRTGTEIASVLITLDDANPGDRLFVARGKRGGERISGASETVRWRGSEESTVRLTLTGCYDDPDEPPLPGCPSTPPGDGGAPDAGGDAGDGGAIEAGAADVTPDALPADAAGDGRDGGPDAIDAPTDRPRG